MDAKEIFDGLEPGEIPARCEGCLYVEQKGVLRGACMYALYAHRCRSTQEEKPGKRCRFKRPEKEVNPLSPLRGTSPGGGSKEEAEKRKRTGTMRMSRETAEKVLRLRRDGMSMAGIALRVGINENTVKRILTSELYREVREEWERKHE